MSYQDIPEELRVLRQWLVWKLEDIGAAKPTKVPYDPKTKKYAAVDDPASWASFDDCVKASKEYSGIGFVFTVSDPYFFIDLDDTKGDKAALDRQIRIFKEFDTYSEKSPSGTGLHLIGKGKVPAGRKRNFVEIYSSLRYATFTGEVYNKKPIVECQDKLIQLWESMGSGPATYIYQGEQDEKNTDEEVTKQAENAANGDKFKQLFTGDWTKLYPSQSEADFALIDIIAFYTQNRKQIARIFRSSGLGNRDKAKRNDYIAWMINRSFDRILPSIDFDGFKNALEDKLAQRELPLNKPSETEQEQKPPTSTSSPSVHLPPGLLGELAQFIYAAAPRPVPEIALAASIGLMAGIAGRAYNVSGTGLNQYMLLLAPTGSGKEGMASGIDRLMNAIRFQVPTSINVIGPSEIASGQAILKYLSKNSQCFVSILGEFGIRLQQISNIHANAAERGLKRMLLDLYNKSGHGQMLHSSIYADSDKNTSVIEAPAFSILAESTPDTFYGALNEDMISEGLLPRFMIIEYTGWRPALNENHLNINPPNWLIDKLASFVEQCATISHHKRVANVISTPEADKMFRDFDKYCDNKINNSRAEILKQLWNRAHMKALKLAALVAVGVNIADPIIMPEYVVWAINIVENDIKALSTKFEQGEVGHNNLEIKQNSDMIRIIKDYLIKPFEEVSKYMQGMNNQKMHQDKIIPYVYINRKLVAMAAFRGDKNGATFAIKRNIQILIDSDRLREIPKSELAVKWGTTQRAFVVSNTGILD